jgi:hypothetical protein
MGLSFDLFICDSYDRNEGLPVLCDDKLRVTHWLVIRITIAPGQLFPINVCAAETSKKTIFD